MDSGFSTWKDVLEVVGVPVAVALAALVWPSVQLHVRRRAFTRLIFRELQEVGPYPEKFERGFCLRPLPQWLGLDTWRTTPP
jgi:hypothetical protein